MLAMRVIQDLMKKTMKRNEITLFGLVILMLSYAWSMHFFYGVILDHTGESIEHAVFWSVLYPVSIFLLCDFFTQRFKLKLSSVKLCMAFLVIGFSLSIGLNELIWYLFGLAYFWAFATLIIIISVLMELLRRKIRL